MTREIPLEPDERCMTFGLYINGYNQIIIKIAPTETGFDVIVPEGITMTDAAEHFIFMIKNRMKMVKLWESQGGNA